MPFAKNLLKIERQTKDDLYIYYSFGNVISGSGATRISKNDDFYGIPYHVLLRYAGHEVEMDDFQDKYPELKRYIEDQSYFKTEFAPCCLMKESELDKYLKFLNDERSRTDYYNIQTIRNIDLKIDEVMNILKSNDYLSDKDAETTEIKKPLIDRERDIYLSYYYEDSYFNSHQIHLVQKLFGKDSHIIFQPSVNSENKFRLKRSNNEKYLKISEKMFNKIDNFLSETKVPVKPNGGMVLDGCTKSMKIGLVYNENYYFNWKRTDKGTERLDRLTIFLENIVFEKFPDEKPEEIF